MPAEGLEQTGFSPTCLLAQAGPDLGHPVLLGNFTAGCPAGPTSDPEPSEEFPPAKTHASRVIYSQSDTLCA